MAPALITLLTGGRGSLPPEVFGPAVQYVRIRALGFPAAAVLGSAQSACLGLKDTTTPLLVLGAAAILNVVGDMSLVGMAGNRLVHGIVEHFGGQMMQRAFVGAADIHTGAFADRLQALEDLDILCRIAARLLWRRIGGFRE